MISVIIPTKNVEDKLEGCLRAVLNQNGVEDSCEVIAVDDGSTDRTGEIAEGFGVRVVRLEGVGPVCTANQCRSLMAMALMRKRLEDQGMTPDWVVESAGTWAEDGITATDNAIEAIRERDLDLVPHLSRRVTEEMMASYDLILAMVNNHKEALHVEFPEYAHKVFLLSEMVGGDWDPEDPVGKSLEDYRATANLIEEVLEEGWERIIEQECV